MESLRAMCEPRRFLLVGDTKLISYGNVAAMTRAQTTFIAPASKAYVDANQLRAANALDTAEVDYVARRDEAKAPEARGRYRVGEDTWAMAATSSHKGEPITLRRVFVWSSADAGAAVTARAKKLERATTPAPRR